MSNYQFPLYKEYQQKTKGKISNANAFLFLIIVIIPYLLSFILNEENSILSAYNWCVQALCYVITVTAALAIIGQFINLKKKGKENIQAIVKMKIKNNFPILDKKEGIFDFFVGLLFVVIFYYKIGVIAAVIYLFSEIGLLLWNQLTFEIHRYYAEKELSQMKE